MERKSLTGQLQKHSSANNDGHKDTADPILALLVFVLGQAPIRSTFVPHVRCGS